MGRRLFASATAAAVLGSTLALGQVSVNAAPAPAVDSVKVDATPSRVTVTPRALEPLDVLKAVKGLYDAYETCKANEAVGQPCGASDSDNIRAALDKLDRLERAVKDLQNSLDQKLSELDLKLSRQELNEYRRSLVQIDENVPHAIGAFSALVDCQAAKLAGESDCTRFSLAGIGQTTPVDDGIDYNRQVFLTYTDENRLPSDLTGTIATYAGSSRSGALSDISFAYVMWRFTKLKFENRAGVSAARFRSSDFVPIVTPSLATEVNTYLQYYGDLLSTFGEVLYLRAIVMRDQAVEEDDARAARQYQNVADNLRDQIARKIDSPDANSVAGIAATYRLSPLRDGDIIMADDDGVGAMVFDTGNKSVPGVRPMFDTDVAALARGLDLYSSFARFKEKDSDAFPRGSGWYTVRARTIPLLCDSDAVFGERGLFRASWLPSVIDADDRRRYDVVVQTARVKLLDSPPTWSRVDRLMPSPEVAPPSPSKTCGDGRGKNYVVNVWTRNWNTTPPSVGFQANELRFPMTYDWDRQTYFATVLFTQIRAFIGEGVAINEADGSPDSILVDTSANELVRWPEGFKPTGMPADYRR